AIARGVCDQLNRRLYRVGLDALPTARSEIDTLIRLWQREVALLPVALYIDAESLDTASAELVAAFQALTAQDIGLVFVALRDAPAGAAATGGYALEVEKPTPAEQRDAWIVALRAAEGGAEPSADAVAAAKLLAGQFNLDIHEIREAAELAVRSAR